MEIYNVNPKGQQTLIDSSDMAAGQMVGLGPYQFTNQTGDESLRNCSRQPATSCERMRRPLQRPPHLPPFTSRIALRPHREGWTRIPGTSKRWA
jgi:hypothetical protein